MKILILAVGDKLPAWAETAVNEYLKRMPREARVEVVGIRPEKRAGQSTERIKSQTMPACDIQSGSKVSG